MDFLRRNITIITIVQTLYVAFNSKLSTWEKFKTFLYQNLRNSWVFIYNIKRKIKKAVQYQLKKIEDFAAYFKYFSSILTKFNNSSLNKA